MSQLPYLKWYPADIMTSRRYLNLSLEERCLYRELIDYSWLETTHPACLPDDEIQLSRMIGINPRTFRKLWRKVGEFFSKGDGKEVENSGIIVEKGLIYSPRLLKEMQKAQEKTKKNKANGLLGGRPKKSQLELELELELDISPKGDIPNPDSVASAEIHFDYLQRWASPSIRDESQESWIKKAAIEWDRAFKNKWVESTDEVRQGFLFADTYEGSNNFTWKDKMASARNLFAKKNGTRKWFTIIGQAKQSPGHQDEYGRTISEAAWAELNQTTRELTLEEACRMDGLPWPPPEGNGNGTS